MSQMQTQYINGGIGAFGPFGSPTPAGVPGTKFTGPSLQSALLETPGSFGIDDLDQEYAFKSWRVHGWPYHNSGNKTNWVPRFVEYWHRVAVATTDKTVTFFNGAQSQFVTNLKNGEVPKQRPMWMLGLHLRPLEVAVADGSLRTNYANVAAATTAIDNFNKLAKTLSAGVLKFTTDTNRNDQFTVMGVDRFLPGGGLDGQVQINGFAAAQTANTMTAGGPKSTPGFVLPEPIPLIGGRSVSATVDFQSATVPAAVDFVLAIYGVEIVAATYK